MRAVAAPSAIEITPQMQERIGDSIQRALQRRMLGRPQTDAATPPALGSPLQMLRPLPE